MAGAIWQDRQYTYLCMLPGADQPTDIETLTMNGEEWRTFLRQTDLLETEILAQLEDGKIGKILVRKTARQISQNVSWLVYRRDGFKCRYCGASDRPLTVDHLVLWEEGGPSIPDNLAAACGPCNSKRGNMPYAKWLESPYYRKVSRGLTSEEKRDNELVAGTLDSIPRLVHKPKRR